MSRMERERTATGMTAGGEGRAPGPPLMARLKAATAAHHRDLERRLPLAREDLTLGGYRGVLARFLGFYEPWEDRASAVLAGPLPGFFGPRRKVPRLRDDLRWLGVDPGRPRRCPGLPPLDDPARVLGSMYVLEGATLGGGFVARHLERTLGLSGGLGTSFFRPYGADVGRMWADFGRTLEGHAPPGADGTIIASAVATFEALGRWLPGGDA